MQLTSAFCIFAILSLACAQILPPMPHSFSCTALLQTRWHSYVSARYYYDESSLRDRMKMN